MSLNTSNAIKHLDRIFTIAPFTSVFVPFMEGVGFYEVSITGSSYSFSFILQIEQFNSDPLFRPFVGASSNIAPATRNNSTNSISLTTPAGENLTFDVDNNNGDLLIGAQAGGATVRVVVNKI